MAPDPYKYFRIEAHELVEQLGAGILELERGGLATAVVARLLRLAHTLKGAARVVKEQHIARLAHEIEDLLEPLRDSVGPVAREPIEGVLARVDGIGARVRDLTPPREEAGPAATDEAFRTLRTDVFEMDGLLAGIAETQTRVSALRRGTESLRQARRLAGVVAEPEGGDTRRDGARANVEDLRRLLDSLERGLTGETERLDSELREVRAAGERLRLLPVAGLFGPLERTVRDAAQALGKRAAFRGVAGDVRLDGHVLGGLQPALVQLVRNAVAHGIEGTAERLAAGKPPEGHVVVEVARRGTRISFTCRDDGRGIDIKAVEAALRRKGANLAPQQATDVKGLLRRLLEGGVTTATAVTDVAGRGVGLDVVREAAARLGAEVSIDTDSGRGTTIEILVPVSLASLDALIVESNGGQIAIPIDSVREALRVRRQDVVNAADGDAIAWDDELLPFAPLARLFGTAEAAGQAASTLSAVVVAGQGRPVAVGVDRVVERASVLVRTLPPFAPAAPLVAGVRLDAEGYPQPVLDPERLADAVRGAGRALLPEAPASLPILVVDDSLTTRMLEQSILESAGYAVELASSAEEALEKVRRQRYALLLVDVEMPGIDGFELLSRLQGDPALQRIPCILVTSRNAPEDRARGAQVGARAYVVKSEFDQVDLLRRIRSLVQ